MKFLAHIKRYKGEKFYKKLSLVCLILIIGLGISLKTSVGQLQTLRTVLNDVWDKANHKLMLSSWVGGALSNTTFETETVIWNDVWDQSNHFLKTNGSGGGGGGDFSSNTSTSVDSEVVLFSGTTGKTGKRATGSGIAKLTGGVLGTGVLGTDYGDAVIANGLQQFPTAGTTSAQLATLLSDEVGSSGGFVRQNGSITGNSATATALDHNPTACPASQWVTDVDSAVALTCSQPNFTDLTGSAASAQLPNPSAGAGGKVRAATCGAGDFINSVNTDSTVTCATPSGSGSVASGSTDNGLRYTGNGSAAGPTTGYTASTTRMKSVYPGVTTVSGANATLGNTDYLVYCNAGASDRTITLPAASTTTAGRYEIWKNDTGIGKCKVTRAGSDTINGSNGSIDLASQWTSTILSLPDSGAPGNWVAQTSIVQPFNVISKTTTYQVLIADFNSYTTIVVPSGTFTITLVASTDQPQNGLAVTIINYGSGVVTVARSGQNLNGGTTSLTLPASSATAPTFTRVYSDGTNYVAEMSGSGSGGGTTYGFHQLSMQGAKLPSSNAAIIMQDKFRPYLIYDAATSWCASWTFQLNSDYGTAPQVVFNYRMASATSGSFSMGWSVWKTSPAQAEDAQTEGYATVNTCTDSAVQGTAGRLDTVTCVLTNDDSMAAGDTVTLRGCRDIADTATGNAELISAALRYTK